MIDERLLDLINRQIQREFYSAYFYMSMKAYFKDNSLDGFANFFDVQVKEERDHALKLIWYLEEVGGKLELRNIEAPPNEFNSPKEIFELTYKHEQFVTASIYEILDLAHELKDHKTISFLQWFVDEQVEEESNMETYLNKLKFIANDASGIFIIDNEMKARVYTPAPIGK